MKKVKIEELKDFSVKALEKSGVSHENAEIIADVLITTDTFGVLTHGTKNLGQYIDKMKAGGLDAAAEPSIVREGPAWAIVNGNKAAGMVSGYKAMKMAIQKAKKVGIAYVGVKNSCHFGAAGFYANLAAKNISSCEWICPQSLRLPVHFFVMSIIARYSIFKRLSSVGNTLLFFVTFRS